MPSSRRPALLLPALALNVLIASATFLVAKRTLAEFPPLVLALFRFLLASALLWPVARLVKPRARIAPQHRGRIWLLGLIAVPLNQGMFLVGLKWASASHGALLYALTPAFVMLIMAVRGGPRPGWIQLAGVAIAFFGVVLLLSQRGLHFDRHSVRGDLLVFCAVIAWAAYLVAGRGMTRLYGPLVVTSEALRAGTLIYLPIGLFALVGFHPEVISRTAWLGLFFLAWLTSVVNYVLWFWGLQHLKAATVAMLTNLQPLVAAALAWIFLHEALPAGFLLSTAFVLAGVWLTRMGPDANFPAPPAPYGSPPAPALPR